MVCTVRHGGTHQLTDHCRETTSDMGVATGQTHGCWSWTQPEDVMNRFRIKPGEGDPKQDHDKLDVATWVTLWLLLLLVVSVCNHWYHYYYSFSLCYSLVQCTGSFSLVESSWFDFAYYLIDYINSIGYLNNQWLYQWLYINDC